MADEFQFTVKSQELGAARYELLRDAAARIDDQVILLSGGAGGGPTSEGDLARSFSEDIARLHLPEVLPLDTTRLESDAPVAIADALARYRFYWIAFPVEMWARKGRGFNELQVSVSFNAAADERLRPRVHSLLPDKQFRDTFGVSAEVKLGVGADLQFSAGIPPLPLAPFGVPVDFAANAKVSSGAKAELLAGPFHYTVRVPVVKNVGVGLDVARWRLENASVVDEKDPGLRAIVKMPRDAPLELEVSAALRARRYFNSFDAGLQTAIRDLPARFRNFFTNGTPIAASATWDLTKQLGGGSGRD